MNFNELPLEQELREDRNITIKVVGVGGAGGNAVDRLKIESLESLHLAVLNTDRQALSSSPVQEKVLLGASVTRGLGAGGDPDLGRQAADSDQEKITEVIKDCDLVFLMAGMGGGTGSGAMPTVAEIASKSGALVVAFVTMPFSFEGGRRCKQAEDGLQELRSVCDAVIPLPNDILLQEGEDDTTVLDAFACADEWMGRGVKSIWAMLHKTGLINLDFAALQQAFQYRGGKTLFGLGSGSGENAAAVAMESLSLCPLLHTSETARRADRLLVNIIGGTDLTLPRVNELMHDITAKFGRNSHTIMGAVIDEDMHERVEICVIGTTEISGSRRQAATQRSTPPMSASRNESGAHPISRVTTAPIPAEPSKAAEIEEAEELALKADQDEFGFGEHESRGSFERTGRNLYQGHDLDVPTYMRKGIKVSL
jgi:cell division protein FtsZ